MKRNMINISKFSIRFFVTILLIFFSLSSFAQNRNNNNSNQNAQRKIEALKRAYLSQQLDLSPKESRAFWPIYEQYQEDRRRIIRERRQNKVNKNNISNPSDQQIEQYENKDFELRKQALQLRKQYREKFRKVIPPHKVMRLYQSEKNFNQKLVKELHRRTMNNNQYRKHPPESRQHLPMNPRRRHPSG